MFSFSNTKEAGLTSCQERRSIEIWHVTFGLRSGPVLVHGAGVIVLIECWLERTSVRDVTGTFLLRATVNQIQQILFRLQSASVLVHSVGAIVVS